MTGIHISQIMNEEAEVHKVSSEVVLELDHMSNDKVEDIFLKLHKGEILGLYGLVGSGKDGNSPVYFRNHADPERSDEDPGRKGRIQEHPRGDRARDRAGAGEQKDPGTGSPPECVGKHVYGGAESLLKREESSAIRI